MIHTICYTSKTNNLTKEEVEAIFAKTYTNNSLQNITGILLHGMDDFFQVLEGPAEVIVPLYEDVICNDKRHTDIFTIIDKPKPKALFADYSSTFNIVRNTSQLENLKSYLRANKESTTAEKMQRLLEPFLIVL
ncbi:BLUF domain-containing protein [Patiriisocius marinus]|uniref:BLUF domain-containing protein n=1 Tax=Patiriisocius marinus TaxID=1397112 RepID=UPI00232ADC35|nr:BLUF domain-containing protein [Patiriisocius marinus]